MAGDRISVDGREEQDGAYLGAVIRTTTARQGPYRRGTSRGLENQESPGHLGRRGSRVPKEADRPRAVAGPCGAREEGAKGWGLIRLHQDVTPTRGTCRRALNASQSLLGVRPPSNRRCWCEHGFGGSRLAHGEPEDWGRCARRQRQVLRCRSQRAAPPSLCSL